VYVTTGRDITPVDLSLIGCDDVIDASFAETLAELEGRGVVPYLTPSDHRGLLCSFALSSSIHPPPSSSSLSTAIERKRKRDDLDTDTTYQADTLHTEASTIANSSSSSSSSSSSESSQEDQPAITSTTSNRRQLFLDALAKRSIA
jgi:hypothetical protein